MAIMDGGEILSKVSQAGKDYSLLTGGLGFLYGVDHKWMATAGPGYPLTKQGLEDMVAGVAGKKVVLMFDKSYTGVADRVFNLGAVLNTGTFAAIGLEVLYSAWPNKYTRTLKNVLQPPAIGYGMGRVFDDPQGDRNYTGQGMQSRNESPTVMQMGGGSWVNV